MDKLEYVLTLARERNLTRAAEKLYISQPSLTNYISRLENELGVKLFDRTHQPITVTTAGIIYIEEMKKIQRRQIALHTKLHLVNNRKDNFSIGIPAVRSEYILPLAIQKFRQLHPNISINMETGIEDHLEKELDAGNLDVAIGVLSMAYPGIRYHSYYEDQIFLLVPRSYACVSHLSSSEATMEHPYLLDADGLSGICILLPRPGGGQYRSAMGMMNKYGIVLDDVINCSNLHTLYQLVGHDVGILFTTPQPFNKTFPSLKERIAFCILQKEPVYQKVYIAHRENPANMALIEDFMKILHSSHEEK